MRSLPNQFKRGVSVSAPSCPTRTRVSKTPRAYKLSPTVACVSSALAVSFVALASSSDFAFATTSNLCFFAAGIWQEVVALADSGVVTRADGHMIGAALVFVFMGAASWAFHRTSVLDVPTHTIDILFGWLLVLHAAYTMVLTVAVLSVDARPQLASFVATLVFSASVGVLMSRYDDVYDMQLTFYVAVGLVAAVFGVICRAMLAYREGAYVDLSGVRVLVVEVATSVSALIAAVFCQGELLGRELPRESSEFDFYHGLWHFLLALLLALLYARARDAARLAAPDASICVCELPMLDWISQGLTIVFSVLATLCKELEVDLTTSKFLLAAVVLGFAAHSAATVTQFLRSSATSATASVHPARATSRAFSFVPGDST